MNPFFTLVMPTLNHHEFIGESVDSVLGQACDDYELIIMDGGSSDGTTQYLEGLPPQVVWRSEPDKGQSDAINKGWELGTGEVLTWVNSDDLLADATVLQRVKQLFAAHPDVDIVFGDYEVIDESGSRLFVRKQAPFSAATLRYCNNYLVPAAFIRRRVLDEIGMMELDLRMTMDIDFWLRALAAGARFRLLPGPMWKHRFHSSSNTVDLRHRMQTEMRRCQSEHWPEWLRSEGTGTAVALAGLRGLLRTRTQLSKLVHRGHVDNLLASYLIRRRMAS